MCVGTDWDAEGACKAEVGQLDVAVGINEQVLWLEVTVKDAVRVAEFDAFEQLEHIALQDKTKQTKAAI